MENVSWRVVRAPPAGTAARAAASQAGGASGSPDAWRRTRAPRRASRATATLTLMIQAPGHRQPRPPAAYLVAIALVLRSECRAERRLLVPHDEGVHDEQKG